MSLGLGVSPSGFADTAINVSTNVVVPSVKRFGINLAQVNYYDSGQLMKDLVIRNPGFEGLLFQSVIRVGSGTATNCVEDGAFTQWPSGFWDGASYDFIWGTAKGRAGTLTRSLAPNRVNPPNDPTGSTNGTTYVFADVGSAPAMGDYMVVRKTEIGDVGGGSAYQGWWTNTAGGGTITTELSDLPPGTTGRQCARLAATSAGQQAMISANCDTLPGLSFMQLNGSYQLTFKAKGVGGNNGVYISLRRGTGAHLINQTVALSGSWATYTIPFTASENGTATGTVSLQFYAANQSAILLDDVSLAPTSGDATNTSAFRDAVVAALRDYRPAILRYPAWQWLGDSLDNQTTPRFGRLRAGYSSYSTTMGDISLGLHEFLELCELIGAEPWWIMPVVFTPQEAANLMEFLGGDTSTPYGARRAALGHATSWTSVFAKIHIEFANEAWNSTFRGAVISDSVAFGNRASEIFGVAKSSPYYNSAKFNFVLGEQAVSSWRGRRAHDACANHDMMTFAPYIASNVDNYANNEELFGSLFAEPEMVNHSSYMWQQYTNIQASARSVPLSVYEVNLHTTSGSISQTALDAFTPSLGAGLAVADHMLMMLRDLQIKDQNLFSLPGYRATRSDGKTALIWSVARDYGVTDRRRPQYHTCKLANDALAGNLVQTTHTGDDPTWTQPFMNRVAYTNAHFVQSYAFATSTNRSLILFNLHRTSALAVNFDGANAPRGNVTMKQLTSAAITDNNESAQVVATTTQVLINLNPAASLTLPAYSMTLLQWEPDTAPPTLLSAVSRKVHGSAGAFDLNLNLNPAVNPTVEPRRYGPTQVLFTFNEEMKAADGVLSANEFTLTNATYVSATIVTSNLTLNLTNVVDQSRVTAVLNGLSDLAGNALVGANAVRARALYGDANQSGTINIADMQTIKFKIGSTLSATNFLYDLNFSGAVNIADMQVAKSMLSHTVPLGSFNLSPSTLQFSTTPTFSLPAATLGEALGAPSLTWSTNGDGLWTPTIAPDGSSAAWSGSIGDLNVSWVETTVTGPGTLTFQWKVSSELNGDFLMFSVDGVDQPGRISGEAGWQSLMFIISAGTHRLTWTYAKNRANARGLDAGWLRRVIYQRSP